MFAQITLTDGAGERIHIQINGGEITEHDEHPLATAHNFDNTHYTFAAGGGEKIVDQQGYAILDATRIFQDTLLSIMGRPQLYKKEDSDDDV